MTTASGTRHVHKQNDLAISSRITDFDVQFSTFRIASPKISIDLGCASVNRNSWGGDPESLGANRS